MNTIEHLDFDGHRALADYLLTASEYGSVQQAVASLTLFTHPDTVRQTENRNLFWIIRANLNTQRGVYSDDPVAGRVLLDDNKPPTDVFLWANNLPTSLRKKHLQFNHIWKSAKDVRIYTSLANICVTPAFLAKLTDRDDQVMPLLRYRAFDIYDGFFPQTETAPVKPHGYDDLEWAGYQPPIDNLESYLRKRMSRAAKNRAAISAREIGWLFSNYEPDDTIPAGK